MKPYDSLRPFEAPVADEDIVGCNQCTTDIREMRKRALEREEYNQACWRYAFGPDRATEPNPGVFIGSWEVCEAAGASTDPSAELQPGDELQAGAEPQPAAEVCKAAGSSTDPSAAPRRRRMLLAPTPESPDFTKINMEFKEKRWGPIPLKPGYVPSERELEDMIE